MQSLSSLQGHNLSSCRTTTSLPLARPISRRAAWHKRSCSQNRRVEGSSAVCKCGLCSKSSNQTSWSCPESCTARQPSSRSHICGPCHAAEFRNTGVHPPSDSGSKKGLLGLAITAAALAAAAAIVVATGNWPALQERASRSVLGRSGFLAAFALIFASEIGDRTFFIAGLLAAKVGKWVSFTGTCLALGLMTVISVGIGYAFKCVPDALKSSAPIGEYAGTALMLFFGVRLLRDAWQMPDEEGGEESDELASAESSLKEYEAQGRMKGSSLWQRLFEVASLIFVAEWGDRSMFATIALGASKNPFGVASGAFLGHAVATVIAVLGGSLAAKYISEKTISYIGGALFIIFAGLTAWGLGLGFGFA